MKNTRLGHVPDSGTGPSLALHAGLAILPNFIIYGAFMASQASNPDTSVNGVRSSGNFSSASVLGFGPGAALYLEPSNVFFSANLLFSQLDTQNSAASTPARPTGAPP